MIRDFFAGLLAVPMSDAQVTRLLPNRTSAERHLALQEWLSSLGRANARLIMDSDIEQVSDYWSILTVKEPYIARVGFRFIDEAEVLNDRQTIVERVLNERPEQHLGLVVLMCLFDMTEKEVDSVLDDIWRQTRVGPPKTLFMEPRQVAAILIEGMKPLLVTGEEDDDLSGANSYSAEHVSQTESAIRIKRVNHRLQSYHGTVVDDPGTFQQKWRDRQKEEVFAGPMLLCTTFLPPVTYSTETVRRFYKIFGATEDTLRLIEERGALETELWRGHIANHQRIDIIDRGSLEEYFLAPEYYQMPLTRIEVKEQVEKLIQMLHFPNYTLCLTPEAVDLTYELRGPGLRIRTDRRNKGQPRMGRVSGVILNDRHIAEVFEREFWGMFRHTESEFKDKGFIEEWLRGQVEQKAGEGHTLANMSEQFDVFLCHNSADKAAVKKIGKMLMKKGIRPWLDEWNLIPGRPWQRALESQIKNIKSAAVFVGDSGFGPWTNMELDAFIREFALRSCPVIPVILPTAQATPELPVYLKGLHWVDFRCKKPSPIAQLIWGIRGEKAVRLRH